MKIKNNQNQFKEQSELLKDESTVADKKPREIVLLKDKLDYIFKDLGANFVSTEKYFLKKLAKHKKRLIIIICFLKQAISLLLKMLIF